MRHSVKNAIIHIKDKNLLLKILKGTFYGIWGAFSSAYIFMNVIGPWSLTLLSIELSTAFYLLGAFTVAGFLIGLSFPFWGNNPVKQPSPEPLEPFKPLAKIIHLNKLARDMSKLQSRRNQQAPHASVFAPGYSGSLSRTPKNAANVNMPNAFEERLAKIKYNLKNIPNQFLDPLTGKIMNNPMMACNLFVNAQGHEEPTFHYYDKETFVTLNGISPKNGRPFSYSRNFFELKAQIEAFVVEQEKLVAANTQKRKRHT